MVQTTRGAQTTGQIDLAYSDKISDYILVRDVMLSKSEKEVARFRAELLNGNGDRVMLHEAALENGAIRLQLDEVPEGAYRLQLELARDGKQYRSHEILDVNVVTK